MSKPIGRPEPTEYADFYAGYVGKVSATDVVGFLEQQLQDITQLIGSIDETQGNFRYEAGKWSIKEVIGHVIDTERVFAYRALVFSRNDRTELPGFDQDSWVQHANYPALEIRDIATEFASVRQATILLFKHMEASAWLRQGMANRNPMTARAAAFIIGGHAQHHLDILKSRYLKTLREASSAVDQRF
jgi:hypothetical protein